MNVIARCGCASDQCGCTFVAGDGVVITGTGSRSNPYVIEAVLPTSSGGSTGGGGGTTTPPPVTASRIVGEIVEYGGATAPSGWLLCNGAAVNRSVYSGLFDVIGTTYGAGDGSTTFNLPNRTDRVGIGAGGGKPRGSTGGAESVTLTTAHLPSHSHTMTHSHTGSTDVQGNHSHTYIQPNTAAQTAAGGNNWYTQRMAGTTDVAGAHGHNVTIGAYGGSTAASSGGGGSFSILPRYLASNYLIKT